MSLRFQQQWIQIPTLDNWHIYVKNPLHKLFWWGRGHFQKRTSNFVVRFQKYAYMCFQLFTFPYCSFTYGSDFPNLSFTTRSFPSTTVIQILLPVLVRRFDDPKSDGRELRWKLFELCEPSESCHSFKTSFTVNCIQYLKRFELHSWTFVTFVHD